jgi:homogentisate 1,2-dioxygenase
MHKPFARIDNRLLVSKFGELETTPESTALESAAYAGAETDFVGGLTTIAGNGDLFLKHGIAIHIFACNVKYDRPIFLQRDWRNARRRRRKIAFVSLPN